MQLKEKKAKRKVNKVNVAAVIASVVALIGLVCLFAAIAVIILLLRDKPKIDLNDFNPAESTIVYDDNDIQIYELGSVIRENVEYEDLPTTLIDAFVATEDSRYFEHSGFDIPRFTKAIISNLKTLSFGQGASTFTMQLVKNTYFVNDDEGQGAVKSIKRKVQEIALAYELEQKASKKEIFVNYLNKLNFGGTSQNIRGIQKACQYYYGKKVNELNLPEAAMLAGVINLPGAYNPFLHLDYAQERRDEVLYYMNLHGYINDDEYKWASSTRVEDFLVDSISTDRGAGNGTPYQAYIDYVVEEVYNETGLDPYTTPMRIHTYMDSEIQKLMDNIQAGQVDGYFEYPDDEFEVASICVNNQTGEIIGILGGRNYADGGALLLNHATDQYKQPGSSIKPILDYAQAFEVLGWSTSHVIEDKPITYLGTDYIISNATNNYAGDVTLKYAVGMSLNTPAIQTIRQLIDTKGNSYLVDYMKNMGFDIDLNDFDEQYGIGGKGLNVSCLQLAGAYAAIMNGGNYIKPHTIKQIEFMNEKAPVNISYPKKQTISEQSCYMLSDLLRNDVEGGYANLMGLFKNDNYRVYAKTGTTNWGSEGSAYNIPNGSIKDGWVVACTSKYSVATWMGYEKGQVGKPSYMNYDIYNRNIKGKISKLILDKTAERFGYAEDVPRPSGITTISHIAKVGVPYVAPIDGIGSDYIVSGYINSSSKYASLVSPQKATISPIEADPVVELTGTSLKITWPEYPDKNMLKVADDRKDISLLKTDGTVLLGYSGNRMFDYTWVFGAVKYKADITTSSGKSKQIVSSENTTTVDVSDVLTSGSSLKACAFYGYENADVNSDQKCVKVEVKDDKEFTLPLNATMQDVVNMFSPYTSNIVLTEIRDSSKPSGSVQEVIINDNKTIQPSQNITLHTLAITKVEIKYYTSVNYTITLSKSEPNNGKVVVTASISPTPTAGNEVTYKWYLNGILQSSETNNTITVTIPSSGTITIKVESMNTSAETDVEAEDTTE